MKKIFIVFCAFFFFISCKKETSTTNVSADTPECVKKIMTDFQGRTVKKWTDGSSNYWSVDNNGNPAIDAQYIYYLNNQCDTVCRVCFCPSNCKIELSKLKEVK
jgi:hypothetical protein